MNRQGTIALLLLVVLIGWGGGVASAQGTKSPSPDMSYLKSQSARVAAKDVPMVTSEGYFDNLESAKKNPAKVLRLNLQGKNLQQIPTDLCLFPNLQELDLSNNQITTLDVSFQCPTQLKKLYINGNKLRAIPAKVAMLGSLEVLVAYDNPVDQIDPSIGNMRHLKELWLSGNGTMASFQKAVLQLDGLTTLRLWNFGLAAVPEGISELRRLQTLCLAHNDIVSLDPKVCALPDLAYLNLGDNQLKALPSEIRQCTKLGYLGIYDNPISSLPDDFSFLGKTLQWLSAWNTNLGPENQNRIVNAFSKATVMFEPGDIH